MRAAAGGARDARLLDEGRLADALGRVASFRSSIVVMTSNLGADASPPVGFGAAPVPDPRLALSAWRPEFVNRIDRIIAFQPLDPEAMRGIVRRELALLAAQPGESCNASLQGRFSCAAESVPGSRLVYRI